MPRYLPPDLELRVAHTLLRAPNSPVANLVRIVALYRLPMAPVARALGAVAQTLYVWADKAGDVCPTDAVAEHLPAVLDRLRTLELRGELPTAPTAATLEALLAGTGSPRLSGGQ